MTTYLLAAAIIIACSFLCAWFFGAIAHFGAHDIDEA